jgi:prepilin-type N-terminal cleavage/methylation domain-containing protein
MARLVREESGFTLIEVLVVMIIAIITSLALFAFQDLALRQTTRVFARVDATQSARVAIEKIESQLHSACVAENTIPIIGKQPAPVSDATNLAFISRYGSAASLTPEKHVISLTSSGTLTDTVYPLASGSAPSDWVFSGTASSTTTVLTNVSQVSTGANVFTYYPYGIAKDSSNNPYKDAAGNNYYMLLDGSSTLPPGVTTSAGSAVPANTIPAYSPRPLGVRLNPTTAAQAAAVKIDLKVFPGGKLNNPNDDISPIVVSNTVVMRITPVPSDNNQGVPPPCQ